MTLKRDSARVPGEQSPQRLRRAAQHEAMRRRTGTFTNACVCDGLASAAQRGACPRAVRSVDPGALHRVRDTEMRFQVLAGAGGAALARVLATLCVLIICAT